MGMWQVGKAYGVSKTLPGPPVFQSNKAPEPKTIDEVRPAAAAAARPDA